MLHVRFRHFSHVLGNAACASIDASGSVLKSEALSAWVQAVGNCVLESYCLCALQGLNGAVNHPSASLGSAGRYVQLRNRHKLHLNSLRLGPVRSTSVGTGKSAIAHGSSAYFCKPSARPLCIGVTLCCAVCRRAQGHLL